MNITREQTYGWIGSLLFGGLILLLLLLAVIRTIIPNQDEGGVLVNFGNLDEAAGLFEPRGSGNPMASATSTATTERVYTPPTPSVTTNTQPSAGTITQNVEESVALAEAQRKETERQAAEAQRRREEEERIREEERRRREEEQRRQNVSNQVSGAFGAASSNASNNVGSTSAATNSQGQGTSTGTGNQGSVSGNSDQGMNTGAGVSGSFSLAGRGLRGGSLPRPYYSAQESGVIVVNITVNPKGNVISASIGRGTTIGNLSLRNDALEAARKAVFTDIQGLNNQSGTITYRYQLN